MILLRHAKSSWSNPSLPDRDRPLATRGVTDAPLMGKAMAERGIDPELVLCSSARRTRDTLALVLPELRVEPKVVYEDALYHAAPEAMLEMLQAIAPGANRVMLVGHNPEIQSFALDLVGSGAEAFPRSSQGQISDGWPRRDQFRQPALWKSVTVNSGTLNLFLSPRDLRA